MSLLPINLQTDRCLFSASVSTAWPAPPQVRSWGYEPLLVSCESGMGLEQVADVLANRTSVVAGPSGRACVRLPQYFHNLPPPPTQVESLGRGLQMQ